MLTWLRRLGLRWTMLLLFGALLVALYIGTGVFVTEVIGDALEQSLQRRARSLMSGLVTRSELPLLQNKREEALDVANEAFADPEVAYVVLVGADGRTVLVDRFKDVWKLEREEILQRRLKDSGDGEEDERDLLHYVRAVKGTRFTTAPADTTDADEELLLGGLDELADDLDAPAPGPPAGKEEVLGYVLMGMSKRETQRALSDVRVLLIVALGVGILLFVGGGVQITRKFLQEPIELMKTTARQMSDYDLTGRVQRLSNDELGEMSDALNTIAENLHGVLGRVQGVTDSLSAVSDRVARTSEVVARGSSSTAASVDQTSSSMQQMLVSLKGIAENVEVLAQSAEESSSSILEMAATNEEVTANIGSLAGSVEETTTAIEQMTYSIKEVAKNIENLSSTAEETSSAMNEMDVSISQVETNANETARLSEQVSTDARSAGDALEKTIAGIDNIRESSRVAADVIEALGQKIATIGNILNVIDEVADQTNLLALNAAIIAAQAGEHGKGFAVVAEEIKDLAERTGASTKEISDLITSVQEESRNAITAMERGVQSVDEGVRLSGEADVALRQILESASKATQMVKAIARATVEQARGSKQVTGAINRIAETVQEIARATAEQARGSEQIMRSAERMKIITKHVERSSQEQARGSKQITSAMENISEMVQRLNRAQKEQTKGAEQVMFAVENIKEATDNQSTAVKDLEAAVDTLSEQSEVLRGEVRRFRT